MFMKHQNIQIISNEFLQTAHLTKKSGSQPIRIPTATHMFSRFMNSLTLFTILCDASRRQDLVPITGSSLGLTTDSAATLLSACYINRLPFYFLFSLTF